MVPVAADTLSRIEIDFEQMAQAQDNNVELRYYQTANTGLKVMLPGKNNCRVIINYSTRFSNEV